MNHKSLPVLPFPMRELIGIEIFQWIGMALFTHLLWTIFLIILKRPAVPLFFLTTQKLNPFESSCGNI